MPRILFIGLLYLFIHSGFIVNAQTKITLNGYVTDSTNGERIIGATLSLSGPTIKNTTTNQYGFFSITVKPGRYEIVASHMGYVSRLLLLEVQTDTSFSIRLQPGAVQLSEEVLVIAQKRENPVKSAQMGKLTLPIEQIKALPAFMGEVDLLKSIQLLPGIRNAGEASAGIYVRGGGADQNLIMLDDAIVYNTGHLFGFFSVFNADAIKQVSLIKGGMPAQYGGRLSSVLDISMKEGNNQQMQVEGGIGLIASRLSIQGPLKKNKSSFMLSGRRTYIDVLTKPFIPKSSSFSGSGYYFYDFNAKANYQFSEKDRLYISGYFGRDVFDFVNGKQSLAVNIPWGNATATVRWNHRFHKKLFSNTTAVFNDYRFTFNALQDNFNIQLASGIRDWTLKQDVDFYPHADHKIKFGGFYTFHRFTPSIVSGSQDTVVFSPRNANIKFAREGHVYVQDDWDLSRRIQLHLGIRYSFFQQVGPSTNYTKDQDGNVLDSIRYAKGSPMKTYGGFEPRWTFRYMLNATSSIKGSVTHNRQYIHLVSNAGTTLPTDIWVPSTTRVKPQLGWQYALGYYRSIQNKLFETSVELYYKRMRNQIEYAEGYTPNSLDDTENSFVFGDGWSYGAECFVQKLKGRWTGWVGYTLSWTMRQFPDLNAGNPFPAKYDRRHDLSIVALFTPNNRWKFSGVFVYATGNAATLPQRFYFVSGQLTQEYSRINQYRLPAYHRIDLSATYISPKNQMRKWKSEWVFGLYNAYSRQNPYFIYFDYAGSPLSGNLQIQAKQVSIFPIIPSITWNFKW